MSPQEIMEQAVINKGKEIFSDMKDDNVSIFRKDYWNGKIMEWSMNHEAFKVEMFRFVDVLPCLDSSAEVARHIKEYFCREDQNFPAAIQSTLGFIGSNVITAKVAAATIRKNVTEMAKMFIAGENPKEAHEPLLRLRKDGIAFTVDILGEAALSESEALDYQKRYMELLEVLVQSTKEWSFHPLIERNEKNNIPRVNVSIKLSSLYSQISPADADHSTLILADRLRPILIRAKELGAFINIDMEQYSFKDITLNTLKKVLEEPALRDYPHVGIAMQAYLRDCLHDLKGLALWAKNLNRELTIRLVKGAYWDYETITAKQNDWPIPVFTNKQATDANFERCSEFILQSYPQLRLALGSHNIRSISNAIVHAQKLGIPKEAIEVQMLYGMAEPIKRAIVKQGYRLRDYVPVGELIPGMAYLVRRLLENTSNESWLRQKFVQGADAETLLRDPRHALKPEDMDLDMSASALKGLSVFKNHAPAQFHRLSEREAMIAAIADVRKLLGQECQLLIGKKKVKGIATINSINPGKPTEIVGKIHLASVDQANEAVQLAKAALPAWEDLGVEKRANILLKAAAIMQARQWELAAWMVIEEAKPWNEAFNDMSEAIDFLQYYAREALRLFNPKRLMAHVSGELNHLYYQPKGVAVVIAPWNFPLAIPTGMVSAALVTGNPVIFKPAEQASVIGCRMVEILREAGVPADALAYLPGKGSEIGPVLTNHKDVAMIAFTGSREVGLSIIETASKVHPGQMQVKRVIAEMGGKNAIIVDSDADLDEAVKGVIYSAFGFSGQKCSACSRLIVLPENYDRFMTRLLESVRSIKVGSAEDPSSFMGAVIDLEAQKKILSYIDLAAKEGEILFKGEVPAEGCYVPPTIVALKDHRAQLAQEEIFGPVLAVLKAKDFDHALEMANDTPFALTGGLYSRSPENIARVRKEFRVGNLYINRGCTGALVGRHPFGGFKMSGVGSKAGGPDYLLQFVDPRSVSENSMRRGFAPEE